MTVPRDILVAAASQDPPAARLDVTALIRITGFSSASVHRALRGDNPRALARIRAALGLAPAAPAAPLSTP